MNSDQALETINKMFSNLNSSISNTIFPLLDKLIFLNSTFMNDKTLVNLFDLHSKINLIIIANALLLAIVLYYSIKLLIAHYLGNEVISPYKFIAKLFIVAILVNYSYYICEQMINIIDFITNICFEICKTIFKKDVSFFALKDILNKTEKVNDMFSINGIIVGMVNVGIVNVTISYALRYILLKILFIISPFMLIFIADDTAVKYFKTWYKSVVILLFSQVIVALVLTILISLTNENEIFSKVLIAGGIYLLFKVNDYVRDFMIGFGIGTNVDSSLFQLMKK